MAKPNKHCPLCGNDLGDATEPGRRDSCKQCHADLHACVACRFHDLRAHNQCREPRAEWQPKRDRANFCDFFELAETPPEAPDTDSGEAQRQRQLDDLFKNF